MNIIIKQQKVIISWLFHLISHCNFIFVKIKKSQANKFPALFI
jgi:hypothetical protein